MSNMNNKGMPANTRKMDTPDTPANPTSEMNGSLVTRFRSVPMNYTSVDMDKHRTMRKQRMAQDRNQNIYRIESYYKQYETPDEVFETIICHQAKGVTFHDKMMDMFGFLGLYGFKKLHEYQFLAESMELRQTKCYVLDHLNLLTCQKVDETGLGFIPEQWYSGMREDVTPETRRECVCYAFRLYKQWEEETRDLYSFCANELQALNRTADYQEVAEKVKDEDEEIKNLEKLILKMEAVDWDMTYITDLQEDIEAHYTEKMMKLFDEKTQEDRIRKNHKTRYSERESERNTRFTPSYRRRF